MIQQWQSEYDTATVKKSFHEVDFEKLARKYIPKDNEVELEKSITTSGISLKAEAKYIIGRNIRTLRKCLLPEVELLENKHLLMFLNNIIKFTKIEHLYLLSTPEVQFSSQISPNVHFSARRFIRLVSDIHLMYSFADSQKGDDFRKAKDLFEYIINAFRKDFCPLIAKHHKSPPKDKSNFSLLEYLYQLNAHLENFDLIIDHKEYTKICSAQASMTNLDDNSFAKNSPILKVEKLRSNYSSESHAHGLSDKSTSSYLSTESNSLRSKMRERREVLGQSHMPGFGHSRIASTSFEQMPNSLLSSAVLSQTKGGEGAENMKNTATSTVEYVKNTYMYSRTLGDLKQYKELKGLKLINEIDVFPKQEDVESRKKVSPVKQKIIKLREEEQNLDPFNMLEISEVGGKEIKVTVNEPHRQLLKTWEEAKRREEEEQKMAEEQKRLAEKRKKSEKGKDLKDADESNSEDDEKHFREVKKLEFIRSRTIVVKDLEEDQNLIVNTFQSSPDSSPAVKINNYTFYRPATLDYQIPAMDYLEKTEKVIELPSEFAEEDAEDYCYKKGSNRRQFLTKLFGEKTRQKLYQDLDDIYSSSPIKTSENNGLTEDLINELREGLENKKIKKLAKASSSKESVFFLEKQRLVLLREVGGEKNEEETKKKEKKPSKASVLWTRLRFAVIMRAFAKRLNRKEISIVNFRTKKMLAYLTQNLNNETKEEVKSVKGNNKLPSKPIGRIIKRRETDYILSSFQGSYILLNSDKGEIDL